MTGSELTVELKRRAASEGFDRVAVAAASGLDRDGAALADWLARGRQAGMSWMARRAEMRADPLLLLPGCRSVVCLALNYAGGRGEGAEPSGGGRVARYAQGRDYHRVIGSRTRRLALWLDEQSGETSRAFVDTAPVLERAWAERAGLGWIGKNANLLSRELGSWLLLGEILTTARLEPDPGPHAEFCGTCTACLDACPTGAIVADGVVDANRCISYWTIEHRGAVPESMRSGIGDWIFGCDVCQEVCPWNASFAHGTVNAFERREDLAALDPEMLLGLDEATFRRRYSGTPLMRARWDGMRRNACIVLGNSGREDALATLATVLEDDPDPLVRAHAAWAVRTIGGSAARAILERAASRESDAGVLAETGLYWG